MVHQDACEKRVSAFYTVRKFQKALGGEIGIRRIYKFLHDGQIKHVKIGRKSLVLASELEDFPRRLLEEEQK